jgi:hypothetical protein
MHAAKLISQVFVLSRRHRYHGLRVKMPWSSGLNASCQAAVLFNKNLCVSGILSVVLVLRGYRE